MAASITVPFQVSSDSISGYYNLSAGNVLTDAVVLLSPLSGTTSGFPVTAFILNATPLETHPQSSNEFSQQGSSVFNWNITNTFPVTAASSPTGTSYSGLTFGLTATGAPCANGPITLTYLLTLSSGALSGNSTGATQFVNVLNTTDITQTSQVTAVNTPFSNKFCLPEFLRLRALGYF